MASRGKGSLKGKMRGKLQPILLGFLCLMLVMGFVPGRIALAEDATLTLKMEYQSGEKTLVIDGVTATAYRVATLDDAVNRYELLPEFESLGVDFNQGLSIDEMGSVAADAAAIVRAGGIEGSSATSGSDGTMPFGGLPYGVYVVVQTGATGGAKGYEDFRPFLISVPQVTEDGVVFDVMSYPKFTPKDAPVPTPPPTPKVSPKTGDTFDIRLVAGFAACGAVILAAGVLLNRKDGN